MSPSKSEINPRCVIFLSSRSVEHSEPEMKIEQLIHQVEERLSVTVEGI